MVVYCIGIYLQNKHLFNVSWSVVWGFNATLTLSQTTNYRLYHTEHVKEFADNNFKFKINVRKFPKQEEKTTGKGEIARYKQFLLLSDIYFLLFPHYFQNL